MADKPVTREEKYLAYLTGDYKGELPKPITRKEKYLYELCLKGIGGEISPEEIKNAVNEYLENNPVKPGATAEQAQQIEQNKTDISSLKVETSSLKEDLVNLEDELTTSETQYDYEDITTTLENGKYFMFNHETSQSEEADVVSIQNDTGKNMLYADVEEGDKYLIEFTSQNWKYGGYGYAFAHNGGPIWSNQHIVDYCYTEKVGDTSNIVTIPSGSTRIYINREDIYGIPTIKKIIGTHKVYESKSYTKEESNERYAKLEDKKTVVIFNFDMTSLDGRYDLMLENGWSATWQVTPETDVSMIKTLVKNGQDLSMYSNYDSSKTVDEIRADIQSKINALEIKGVFRTCLFSCAGHKDGYKLEQALSTLPFRYIRASVYENEDGTIIYPSANTKPYEKRQDVRSLNNYRNESFETIKENVIDRWVNEKRPMLMLMLHTYEYDNFDENKFKQIVAYVKQLENDGVVKVMNAREYYEYYYPEEGKKDDRIRFESSIINLY